MRVNEAVLLEELVDGVGSGAAHAESGVEGVGAGAQGGHCLLYTSNDAGFLYDSFCENAMPDSPQAVRHCSYKNSAVYGQSKAEAI